MTGTEISEIIKQVTALLTAVGVLYAIYQGQKTRAHVETAAAVVTAIDAKVDTNTNITTAVVAKVEGLGKQIDGQQEKLLSAVSEAAIAKGRADVAAEQAHDKAIIAEVRAEVQKVNGTPTPVMIMQDPDKPVPVETIKTKETS